MIPGPLIGAYRGLVAVCEAVVTDIAQAVDRALDHIAGGPAVSDELAAAVAAGVTRGEFVGPYITDPEVGHVAEQFGAIAHMAGVQIDPDRLHHGCWDLRICLTHNTVSVVQPTEGCPLCVSAPAEGDSAGDRPAAESAPPTPPAAGHPNPLLDAAAADRRIAKRLSRFLT